MDRVREEEKGKSKRDVGSKGGGGCWEVGRWKPKRVSE